MLNRVVLIGRLVADPELKHTGSGTAVTGLRLAVDRPYKKGMKQGGGEHQEADFIDCVAWQKNAEFAANYLHKGRLVAVEGRLQIRTYQTQDGSKRVAAEVHLDSVRALDRGPQSGQAEPPRTQRDTADPFSDQ